jgi:hypothetical protein
LTHAGHAALVACVFGAAAFQAAPPQARPGVTPIAWADLAPLAGRLEPHGLTPATFAARVEALREANLRRMREGDLDHLVFYALQSSRFTSLPPIEPAVSARSFVDGLQTSVRQPFLRGDLPPSRADRLQLPPPVRARLAAFIGALDSKTTDPRLAYFRGLVQTVFPARGERAPGLHREYLRAMRFLYDKEFVAQADGADAVARLYRSRGLSTDTAVEAGYVVFLGLGVVKALSPDRRIRRVLIVGPGLDLAPRTGLLEADPPESYQPWAVMDALVGLGLARADELEVVGADINPRVVEHLERARATPPVLRLTSGLEGTAAVTFSDEYRHYFERLGRAIGTVETASAPPGGSGALRKTVRVGPAAAGALRGAPLDIVTGHLAGPPFDLVIATNILPYFDDQALMLAMANITAMLAPGGILLHNEPRPLIDEVGSVLGVRFEQSRHAVIATVHGAPAPLGDSVFLHGKR